MTNLLKDFSVNKKIQLIESFGYIKVREIRSNTYIGQIGKIKYHIFYNDLTNTIRTEQVHND